MAAAGALSGWTVSLIFNQTILEVLAKFGLHGVELWQIGATMGFLGAFLRTNTTVKPEK